MPVFYGSLVFTINYDIHWLSSVSIARAFTAVNVMRCFGFLR